MEKSKMKERTRLTRYLREAIREYWGDSKGIEEKFEAVGILSSDDLVYVNIDEISKQTGIDVKELAEFQARYTPAFLTKAREELKRVRKMYEEQIRWLRKRIGAEERPMLPLPVQKRLRAAKDAAKDTLNAASRLLPLALTDEKQSIDMRKVVDGIGEVCDCTMTLARRLEDLIFSLKNLGVDIREADALNSEVNGLYEMERELEEELKGEVDLSSIRAVISALSSAAQTVLGVIEAIEEQMRRVRSEKSDEVRKLRERLEKALDERNKARLELDKRNREILRLRKLIEMLNEDIKRTKAENAKLKKVVRDVLGEVLD
ncbi:MAG: hypothetical protein DRN96_02915 [Thermoproteota archaeon]|nr:MAG: hypothetical protein DRN96_02915 [Candidatus Korarchaeota archaeon]RLG55927.1 MAG: hypothetical protein DRN99_01155 [Candidatus Korarchaeota archaeon]